MVENLHSKIQAESEARIQRSLDSLEAAAKAESERSRASSEALQRAETQLATKFRAVISDLRKSWEARYFPLNFSHKLLSITGRGDWSQYPAGRAITKSLLCRFRTYGISAENGS